MRTISAKKETVKRSWLLVDLDGKILGRAASRVASILRGKEKPIFTPHVDVGDYVVAVNASKIRLTGKKAAEKIYRYSGYPGGLKTVTMGKLLEKKPDRMFRETVRGMLPKTTLGRSMLRKLKVYSGPTHPHAAQKLQNLKM